MTDIDTEIFFERRQFLRGIATAFPLMSMPLMRIIDTIPIDSYRHVSRISNDSGRVVSLPPVTVDIFHTRDDGLSELICSVKDIILEDLGNDEHRTIQPAEAVIQRRGKASWYRMSTPDQILKVCDIDSAESALRYLENKWLFPEDTLVLKIHLKINRAQQG